VLQCVNTHELLWTTIHTPARRGEEAAGGAPANGGGAEEEARWQQWVCRRRRRPRQWGQETCGPAAVEVEGGTRGPDKSRLCECITGGPSKLRLRECRGREDGRCTCEKT
jgi:hypothetical protein